MKLLYEMVIDLVGAPPNPLSQWLAYATACLILLLILYMFIKLVDWFFKVFR